MEFWEVVGVDVNAKIKFKDGSENQGVRWFLLGDAPAGDSRYRGKIVKDQYISNERLNGLGVTPQPGDKIVMYFNRYGDIQKVEIVE